MDIKFFKSRIVHRLKRLSREVNMKIVIGVIYFCVFLSAKAPQLFLLKTYQKDMNVSGWVMSEKLDGVRAFWDGKRLISRSGRIFNAPTSFTQDFPSFSLDGELWTSRGDFENIVSIVNTQSTNERWDELTYNVFEVPHQKGGLLKRLSKIKPFLSSKLKLITQHEVYTREDVQVYLKDVIKEGGEGVVLRNPKQSYYVGRTKQALKYKLFDDAECRIVSVLSGSGKYKAMMGAIKCDYQGKLIKIGSGFTDEERKHPPSVGTLISFKYYGLTRLGNPKYPVFLRVRLDTELSL